MKVAIAVIAFAGGALAGGLFVRWYVQTHAGAIAGQKLGDEIFGEGSTGSRIVQGIGGIADEVRA